MSAVVAGGAADFWPAPPARLSCVLDAAADPRIAPALRELAWGEEVIPLYEGEAARDLAEVAPYLLMLDPDSAGFAWLADNARLRARAVFLSATVVPAELRAHLRRLTRVRTADGRVLLFRFYDPLVLQALLPTFDSAQLAEMFGPIEQISLTDENGRLTGYRREGEGLRGVALTQSF